MNIFIPNKILYIAGGVFILIVGIVIGASFSKPSVGKPVTASNPPTVQPTAGEVTPPGDKAAAELVKVSRVIDGDTIEIEGGERVRYIGMDTPETVDPRKPVQCFGVEASKKNKELVEGKMVRLEKDITNRDKYNRLLRYVWLGDTLVNLELVKQGFAHSYSYPPDVKYQEQIVAAEKQAREAKLGLWNACPATTALPATEPQTANTNSSLAPADSCTIKGNISASGEKIYHLLGCGSYAKTIIDLSRGERWFCSETEAQTAG